MQALQYVPLTFMSEEHNFFLERFLFLPITAGVFRPPADLITAGVFRPPADLKALQKPAKNQRFFMQKPVFFGGKNPFFSAAKIIFFGGKNHFFRSI